MSLPHPDGHPAAAEATIFCELGAGDAEAAMSKRKGTPATSPGDTPPQALSPHDSPSTSPWPSPPTQLLTDPALRAQPLPQKSRCLAGDVASPSAIIFCGSTLTDVCDTLEYAGHSAAVVVGEDGALRGILTENDILKAYSDQVAWDYDADLWLQSGDARMPGFLLPVLTVEASMPLADAAAKMAVQRLGDYACHHLLVGGATLGHHQILSALDVAMALCNGDLGDDAVGHGVTVGDLMKCRGPGRGAVPECLAGGTIKHAFDTLLASGHNCALVVEHDGGLVCGTITPRDAVRAFVEHVPVSTAVGGWLRGVGSILDPRLVDADMPLLEAAQLMVSNSLHHLLVVEPGTIHVVGVLSCLDVVSRIGARRLGEWPASLQPQGLHRGPLGASVQPQDPDRPGR